MNVADYFEDKNIFLTGGSGFVGKALIEKLLRTVSNLGVIYILLRPKKGKSPQERLKDMVNDRIFDVLKETNPSVFQKLICIEGDSTELKLGINDNDRKILTENVNIIYNCAASIRFDDPLHYAIIVNVRSTRELIELAKETKHLKAFVHVSTTYCNSDKQYVEEKLYPSHGNWRDAIRLAEEADDHLLNVLTQKYIHPLPNTYTYAKSLSEHTVHDLCYGQIPAIIVRPSIVINMYGDPLPGWIDNMNGPVGLFTFGATGLLRVVYGKGETQLDQVPVDFCTRVLIIATCDKIKNQNSNQIEIYNNSLPGYNEYSLQNQITTGYKVIANRPSSLVCWIPNVRITNCRYNYYFRVILFHLLPALLIDLLLRVTGHKLRLLRIHKKAYIANTVLYPFMSNTYHFYNTNAMALGNTIPEEDLPEYNFESYKTLTGKYFMNYMTNSGSFIAEMVMNIKVDLENRQTTYKILWILDKLCTLGAYVLFIWIFIKSNILGILYNSVESYLSSL